MAIGHYIRRGDKTACGGVVLEGHPSFSMHGVPVARAGDAVTCGKDGQHYVIAGGFQHFMISESVAGTLDSASTCPCRARLIHSLPSATYQSDRGTTKTVSEPASASSRSVAEMRVAKPMAEVDRSVGTASVFAKCCKLPDSVIDYSRPSGAFPIDSARDFGNLVLLGGRDVDESGKLPLKKISGSVPSGLGSFALRGLPVDSGASSGGLYDVASAGGALAIGGRVVTGAGGRVVGGGVLSGGVVGGALLGVVAMLWPSSLGDSALYTEEQLRSMKQARTRVRISVETQPDGTLKCYGYNTELRRDWEMIPVVQFARDGSQMVADFGGGIELIWTPATNPTNTLGIPALEAAPQAPQISIYPPTERADSLIVNPIYPPEYGDFILVFPAVAGIAPLYIVLSLPTEHSYYPAPKGLTAFPDAQVTPRKTPIKGGGGLRKRWKTKDGTIFEWDSQHGAVEKYNKRGKHLGEFDPKTGEQTKGADSSREVEP